MMRGIASCASMASVVLFPWPVAAVLAIVFSVQVPLLPVAVGLFTDVVYWHSFAGLIPLGTVAGCVCTIAAFLVRMRLNAGIIGE
jgi:hypothetical protein